MKGPFQTDHRASINITPMIDVLLVLLILFLVIQPALTKGIDLQVPTLEERADPLEPPDQIVLHVASGPTFAVNQLPVPADDLAETLHALFAERPRKVLFLRGDGDVPYGDIIAAADAARAAGIEVIGLAPRRDADSPRTE